MLIRFPPALQLPRILIVKIRVVLDGDSDDIQQLTSKKLYGSLITSKAKEPSGNLKFTEYFLDEYLDWKTIYKILFLTTIDTRTRIFQFKIVRRILFTNSSLFKMKLVSITTLRFLWFRERISGAYFL